MNNKMKNNQVEDDQQEFFGEEESSETTLEKESEESELQKLIDSQKEQIDALQDKLLRQMAESENIRTRSAKLVEESKDYSIFNFTKDLVPVMDNLERALEHIPEDLDSDMKNIVEGIKMTRSELESVFTKHKLESIKPQSGDKFDYNLHHAISQIVTEEFEVGTIVNIMQVGYKIKDRLIRPAAVTVAKASKK